MVDAAAPTPVQARVRQVMVFVAIVWTVAASFVAFEQLGLFITGLLGEHPETAALQLSGATKASKTCETPPGEGGPPASPEATAAANVNAWSMGLALGRDALHRQRLDGPDPKVLGALEEFIERSAQVLSVPSPEPFVARQLANANTEFVGFVEADQRSTARALALRHAAQACYLFKLGAFWGYSGLVLVSLPDEPAVFSSEMRHYALLSGLPATLWLPMVESPDDARAVDSADIVTEYLGASARRP